MRSNWQPCARAQRRRAGYAEKVDICPRNVGTKAKEEESTEKPYPQAKEEIGDRRCRKARKEAKQAKVRTEAKERKEAKDEEKEEPRAKDQHLAALRAEDRTGKANAPRGAEKESGQWRSIMIAKAGPAQIGLNWEAWPR